MSIEHALNSLLSLSQERERHQWLTHALPQFEQREIVKLVDLLKEQVIQSLRVDMQAALLAADCLLMLADIAESPSYYALGLRMKAQALVIGQGRYEEALPLYDDSIAIYDSLGDELGQAHAQVTRIWALAQTSDYKTSVTAGETARTVLTRHEQWRSLATLNNNLAMIHNRFGALEEALYLLDESRSIYQKLGHEGERFLTNNETNRAFVLYALGQFKASIQASERALAQAEAFKQTALIARGNHNLGLTYYVLGHYNLALTLFDQAKEIWQADGRFQEVIQNELTSAYCLIKLRRFGDVLEKCQAMRHLIETQKIVPETLFSLLNEAYAYAGLNRYEEAQVSLVATRQLFDDAQNPLDIAQCDLVRADLYFRQGSYAQCIRLSQACVQIFAQMNRPFEEAQAHLLSARVRLSQGMYELATGDIQLAKNLVEHRDVAVLIYEVYFVMGRIAREQKDWSSALAYFNRAITELERIQGWTMVEFRADFLKDEDKRDLFEETVDLYLEIEDFARAMQAVEQAKSRALMDLVAYRLDLSIRTRAPEDETLVSQLNALRGQRNRLFRRQVGAMAEQVDDLAQFFEEQQVVEGKITALWHQLLIRNAAYANDAVESFGSVQPRKLSLPQTVNVVEYFIVDGKIVAFLLTPGSEETPQVFRLSASARDVDRLLQLLNLNWQTTMNTMADRVENLISNARGVLHQLYQRLWEPLSSYLTGDCEQIVIIPHGTLHYLPFHALYDGAGYLLETYQISYLPSISFWQAKTSPVTEKLPDALVIGYSSHGRLPQAQYEAEAVAKHWSGQLLLEEEATLGHLEKIIGDYQIIHMATHGEFRSDNPLFSGLTLADGELTSLDIFNLKLNAPLVVLSACHTGRSVIGGGDELLGLMRAFFASGAVSLILTHWAIADEASAELMIHFYQELAKGVNKSAALRAAQLRVLQSENGRSRYAHPYFWASFFLVGEAGPL
ncbi:MAG: CHAT domain-containing protein [Chloroflexi bacterium]|nr:CHAT domain-containing protein [Chloroflexota bacterium]